MVKAHANLFQRSQIPRRVRVEVRDLTYWYMNSNLVVVDVMLSKTKGICDAVLTGKRLVTR
jgi:hypothetical protein